MGEGVEWQTAMDRLQAQLDRIECNMRPLAEDRWWTYEDVAAFLQCSDATARRMLKQPGAPKPCALQTDASGSVLPHRFIAEDVRQWAARSTRASEPARRRRVGSRRAAS